MSISFVSRPIPAPAVYPDNQEFWDAASAGRLLLKYCLSCDRPHWYPRPHCPHCGGARTAFRQASGMATIYSVSVTRRAGPHAYAVAYVTLDEGITMMTNIVDCDLEALRIGDRVQVVFKPSEGGPAVPMFTPHS